ncbi:cell division cycle protein [Anaeramoeba ignava]|uniref:Cell division cycle protein n=1 Tax=Anaeramoeba ignava TaxID=1746090 RepID=A0A9Q0LFG6_ANAIG|nr:cell division cycle protein [Anaeramoeba ignava]
MSLSDKLKKVQLKKTTHQQQEPKKPEIISLKTEEDNFELIQNYTHRVFLTNIEYWINILEKTTFKTILIPMNQKETEFLIQSYEHLKKSNFEKFELTNELQIQFDEISNKLEKAMLEMTNGDPTKPVFIKSSCRSPKDSVVYEKEFLDLYKSFLEKQFDQSINSKIWALTKAGMKMLQFTDARKVVQTLCSSSRIYNDMNIYLKYLSPNSENPKTNQENQPNFKHKEHFVVREWIDMEPEMEFRGFVTNYNLNALSQYHYFVYFPNLVEKKKEIQDKIVDFYKKEVQPLLQNHFQSKDYIVDFCVSHGKVWVIELNAFEESTDAGLFDWEKEINILSNGPFEFRIQTEPPVGIEKRLSEEWQKYIN